VIPQLARRSLEHARKLIVAVLGLTVLLLGLALIVLPGPAVVVIPVGLAILATEFLWARRLLRRMRTVAERLTSRGRGPEGSPINPSSRDSAPSGACGDDAVRR
jgi:tellurite resistance protein TerC